MRSRSFRSLSLAGQGPQLMSWTALHSTGIFVGHCGEEDTMEDIAVVGVDLAKSVFQVHGIDAQGQVVLRRKLSRSKLLSFFATLPRCLIGMETCASANHWARELIASAPGAPDARVQSAHAPSSWRWRRSPCRSRTAAASQRMRAASTGSASDAARLALAHRSRAPGIQTLRDPRRQPQYLPSCPPLHSDQQKSRSSGAPSTTSIATLASER